MWSVSGSRIKTFQGTVKDDTDNIYVLGELSNEVYV